MKNQKTTTMHSRPLAGGLAAALLACAVGPDASAQVQVQVSLPPPPSIRFDVAPPLVEVLPGIQVVANHGEEVFFAAGWFWVRRDATWFRTRDPRHPQWVAVDAREVPVALIRLTPGRFVRWHGSAPAPATPVAPPPAAPPTVGHPPPVAPLPAVAPPARQQVLRTKELRAHRVRARVIYAKEVTAGDGQVGRIFEGETEEWERGRSDGKVDVPEVDADVIYAKEVKADWVEASEIHAKEIKIGRKGGHDKHRGRGHDQGHKEHKDHGHHHD